MDKSYIIDANTQKKKIFGQYFFDLFNKPITRYLLNIPDTFIYKLFIEYPLNDYTFHIILETLKLLNKNM